MLTVVQLGLTGTSVFMSVLSRVENADDDVCEVECSAGNERVSEGLKSSLKLSLDRLYSVLLMQTPPGRTSYCHNIHTHIQHLIRLIKINADAYIDVCAYILELPTFAKNIIFTKCI